MEYLPEESARRGDWSPGVAIRMADGQLWHFRRPRVKFRCAVDADGKPFARRFSVDEGRPFLEIMEEIARAPGDEAAFARIMGVTLPLLRQNYDVPDGYVGELYAWEPDHEPSRELWERLFNLAVGQSVDPPSPVG